ncbi:hypothetical protein C8J56DRAFT_144445 [Mycena floridula]|nr:hypothetical protein C8J56DRAFT_144445 [Mycena floridula]
MFQSGQRSQSSYQNQVKVFCMTAGLKLHQILSIFSACSNLRMLGMFYWDDEHKSTAELDASLDALAASGPSPPKLACDLRWTLHHEGHPHAHRLALPLFQNVTHLELHSYDNFLHFDTKHLHVLPTPSKSILDRLHPDPRIVFAVDDMRLDESEHRNKTILWRPLVEVDHFIRQWGRRLDGEEEMDMWEEAEAIVKVQRALQVSPHLLRFADSHNDHFRRLVDLFPTRFRRYKAIHILICQ